MSYNYRCSKRACRKRVSLKQPIERYARVKLCVCGHDSLKLDKAVKKQSKLNRCYCDGYHFPHNKNSLFCVQSSRTPTNTEIGEHYGYV